jgi:CDP-paratose 2-epimerase
LTGKRMRITTAAEDRPFDIPYFVTDYGLAEKVWKWKPSQSASQIVESICRWAHDHQDFVQSLLNRS